ncbi:CBS domain containing-hemolysin-like protein [Arthrobacter stackebrandtii]|uniref:CBS domain containing-hemolysin-like protein n=2 Tax=Arthrobacter stackebrandtii TaxID=272161 RepID=A0ABS4Z054_9MICC|nr:hemolysin family protein [Arthrobacter stackebrandtii]MBP2414445.1 CBS domain containing-hemolysin-like protein [Arthrobacter stackebrandtii]PYH01573.1 ion transporter [Arthrobacter stackebrandtii]
MLVALPVMGVLFTAMAAFLAALESALSFFPRHDSEAVAARGRRPSLEKVLAEPAVHLNALRFWRVWSEMAAAVAVAMFLVRLLDNEWIAGLIATVVMAVLGFMLVGVSPRQLGRMHAAGLSARFAWLIHLLRRILGPVPEWLIRLGSVLAKGAPGGDDAFVSEEEFREFVDRASEADMIEDDEAELIHSVFDLGETMVRAVMVPRTDIVSADQGATLEEALEIFLRSGFSRIPVIRDSSDHILGVLYLKDVVATLHRLSDRDERPTVEQLARSVRYVPESKTVADLLKELQRESTHFAIVVDEYGGTAGLVTLEDLIEEIVGEIADEYDQVSPDAQLLADGSYRVKARMAIDELGELFGKDIEDDEVDTAGGLLAKHLGKIPAVGNSVEVSGILLVAERIEGSPNRVSHLIASAVEPAENDTTAITAPTEQQHRSDS